MIFKMGPFPHWNSHSKQKVTARSQLWVYNSENCFVGFFYQFTCRVERTKGLEDKTEFWDRLMASQYLTSRAKHHHLYWQRQSRQLFIFSNSKLEGGFTTGEGIDSQLMLDGAKTTELASFTGYKAPSVPILICKSGIVNLTCELCTVKLYHLFSLECLLCQHNSTKISAENHITGMHSCKT